MRSSEARLFLELQRQAVRGLAVDSYPAEVVAAWAPLPVTDDALERFTANRDEEIRLIAECDGEPAGIGALILAGSELRACYVAPWAAQRGVGRAIVAEIERIARQHGLARLRLQASVNAEPFYAALGYDVVERGTLEIAAGIHMAAITMEKPL
jgi:putative acetyltransferase